MSIEEKLEQSEDRATLKGEEIAVVLDSEKEIKEDREHYKIEIVSTNPIPGGIEVFIRAWDGNGQIGFGIDGTVDVERIKIYNPPILVADENGDIVREWTDLDGVKHENRFREDPKEALLQSIEHTINVKKEKFGSENIVAEKVGNTTSTFYPDASSGGTTVDGFVGNNSGSTWNDIVTATTGAEGVGKTDTSQDGVFSRYRVGAPTRLARRGFYTFDTSTIGTDTISSATFSLYVTAVKNNHTNTSKDIALVSASPASNNDLVANDFDNVGSTEFATRVALASATTSAYNDWALNASGISNVNKTGISGFATRTSWDIDNTEPSPQNNTGSGLTTSFADETGTSQDPKLVVEHSTSVNLKDKMFLVF